MKKLVAISLLLVLMSTAAFAQFKVGFTADITPDLIYVVKDTEDKNEPKGSFNILGSSVWDSSELRLTFGYTGENFEAFLEIKGDSLVNRGSGFFNGTTTPSFNSFLGLGFGDYYVKGTAGILSGYVGNTAQRGKMEAFRFQNFNDYLHNKIDNYGYIAVGGAVDVDNLKNDAPYVSAGVTFAPLTIELASDLSTAAFTNPQASADKIGAALRVSGDKIADLITFDLIYKIKGEDRDNQTRGSGGSWNNNFGIYAGLGLGDIGIGFGFSGGVKIDEADVDSVNNKKVDVVNPFYAGIDLRFQFTGIDKLTLTFNNNITFSGVKGSNDKYVYFEGSGPIGDGVSVGWFALYNALGLNYALTERLTATLQLANVLGSLKTEVSGGDVTITGDQFYVTASTAYAFNANVSFEAGVGLGIEGAETKPSSGSSTKNGTLYFGIPLRFLVTF
jgi:hypothetical protein